ncbi:ESPR domain-containing protein [Frederiksenia canicola]|uniref:ESPR domain-containing protein n=1 Tax=Frederiksenia canicola TaxID=123824 RepID=UPI000F507D16
MNKDLHRVIFSKTQQYFVVVSELSKTTGKSSAFPKVKVDDFFSQFFNSVFTNTSG